MTLERCKDQVAICEKKFVSKVWLLLAIIGCIGTGFGIVWGASAWQTKTEMRIGAVEMVGTENGTKINAIRHDLDKLQMISRDLDSIKAWTRGRE